MAVCSLAAAADPPKPAQPSTDDALRDSLDAHSGDEYDRALLGGPGKPDANKKDRGDDDLEKKLKQQLGPAAQREDQPQHPLLKAAQGMREVQTRLAQRKSDAVTQFEQRQVVADLQKIIDEAKKSGKCLGQNCMGGCCKPGARQTARSAPKPGKPSDAPARTSNPNAAPPARQARSQEELAAIDIMNKQFNIRLQARRPVTKYELPSEHFLPEYEREIEDYFRRLSGGTAAEH